MARGPMGGRYTNGDDDDDHGDSEQGEEINRRLGSILKVTMKDFITYDSVECHPGESLNVVIGPNGTGKSTILSAIVLGLGGKPAHLGKPNAPLQDFIKNHRQEATITIELLGHKRNTIVKRTILKDGKSIWNLNGRQVNMREIEAETKRLNIQIDNLCQVLAQDRVQDFAKLNKQELLEATQKAVGKEGMSEVHTKLKDLQRLQKQLETQIQAAKKQREIEQGHVERLRGDVEKVEKRRGIEQEADACRLKLSILTYKSKKDETDRYKKLKQEADVKKSAIKAQIEPFERQIKEVEGQYNTIKNKHNGMGRRIQNQETKVSELRDVLANLREEILEIEINLEKQLKASENQQHQEDQWRQCISKLRNDIAALDSMSAEEVHTEGRRYQTEMNNFANEVNRKESQVVQIRDSIMELTASLSNINRDIAKLENQKELRMRALQECNQNAFRAAKWVDENRHRFEKPVYLPMIVELDIVPQFAKYAETAIGYNDLIAIVCESKNDMQIVIDEVRTKMNVSVNVLQAEEGNAPPSQSLDQLKREFPQFQGFLIDFVKGPATLLNFLCRRKGFHTTPVATDEVEAPRLPLYFSGDYKKGFIRSKYSSNLTYFSDPLQQARFFKSMGSDVDKEQLQARAEGIERKIRLKEQEKNVMKQEIEVMRQKRAEAREKLHKLQQRQTTKNTMTFQLSKKEKELQQMERNRLDPDRVKEQYAASARAAVLKLAEAQEPFCMALKQLDSLVVESSVLEFDVQTAKALVSSTKQLCKKEKEAYENADREAEVILNAYNEVRTEAQNMARAIQNKYNKNVTVLWKDNEDLFSTLPNTLEELESHIEDKTAHAQLLGGGNDAHILQQFQAHVSQFEGLQRTITEKESQAANLVVDMETRENQWKTELNDLVQTISSNFGRYFREMKCAGEVRLYTGNNEHDYDNYGLQVMVKFRDNEDLQELNAHTQSGGERAVSTAIYMLSLQELTPAPFRLVDEINQGMDAINERRVYELLLRSTSRPGTPQYFLLTPKLLKDMEYNRGTTVLCVMNSACAPSHKTWNIKKFVELRRKHGSGGGRHYNGDDVEMGD
ncbi:hypothetical protein ONE63_009389 [Megalurothrips usitatus]|uniref:Structural maintenance of chromosomes protein 5 n=1 Tax=Megalurothrips usitatus TaxID=439358 RepID=A0AAV7XMT6_9NEOP|nr:hypothetical protein ONE63_009389 [Megalurothrips usitatus]